MREKKVLFQDEIEMSQTENMNASDYNDYFAYHLTQKFTETENIRKCCKQTYTTINKKHLRYTELPNYTQIILHQIGHQTKTFNIQQMLTILHFNIPCVTYVIVTMETITMVTREYL